MWVLACSCNVPSTLSGFWPAPLNYPLNVGAALALSKFMARIGDAVLPLLVLQALRFDLVVHSPYRALVGLVKVSSIHLRTLTGLVRGKWGNPLECTCGLAQVSSISLCTLVGLVEVDGIHLHALWGHIQLRSMQIVVWLF